VAFHIVISYDFTGCCVWPLVSDLITLPRSSWLLSDWCPGTHGCRNKHQCWCCPRCLLTHDVYVDHQPWS